MDFEDAYKTMLSKLDVTNRELRLYNSRFRDSFYKLFNQYPDGIPENIFDAHVECFRALFKIGKRIGEHGHKIGNL